MIGSIHRQSSLFYVALGHQASLIKDDLLEPLDALLDDEALVELVRERLAARNRLSTKAGREGIAPDRLLRCCVLKHLKSWSFRDLERELHRDRHPRPAGGRMRRALRATLLAALLAGSLPTPGSPSGDHPQTSAVTIWTDRGELFMEYQVPVAGKPARFTAHLTELNGFRAVEKAAATIRLWKPGGAKLEGKVEGPARPGIFQPVVTLPEAGEYQGELEVAGPDLTETFALERVRVIKDGEAAPHPDEEANANAISFLKEQQWKIPFRTVVAGRRKLVHSIHALGEVKHKPGLSADVTAPVDGRVVSDPPEVGQHLKAGDFLLEIAPFLAADLDRPHLDQELIQATAEQGKAMVDLARISGLVSKGLMPKKELEAAQMQRTIAESKIASARQHRQTYLAAQHTEPNVSSKAQHFQVRAPIAGEISVVDVTRGEIVSRDKRILVLDDPSRVRVELKVFEPDLAEARGATGAVFSFLGEKQPFTLDELKGKLVHVSHHIEAASRTATVVFEIDNPAERLPFGGFVEADILTRQSGSYLAVPLEAVMEDQGASAVYVHTGGEEFEKREVVLGVADRGWVAVSTGVKPGERVVTTGAYQLRLSTLSGAIPEHGHSH